ncbi:plasmid partition protein ParG [Rhizobium tumorigenes]|uniref:plasmid partition protein ParG n=1 Tax=Rhizobium tumorigenes TaxID=2041385 RepID=UPI0031018BD1
MRHRHRYQEHPADREAKGLFAFEHRYPIGDDTHRGHKVVPLHAAGAESDKRLAFDVTQSLHKRIKARCAMRGTHMADVIRELLEKECASSIRFEQNVRAGMAAIFPATCLPGSCAIEFECVCIFGAAIPAFGAVIPAFR